jgi:YjbE family integral membrane protein
LVIALVARNMPKRLRNKVVFWGAFGATVVRVIMIMGVIWLLKIPGFLFVGGLALVWIARKLLIASPEEEVAEDKPAASSLFDAVKTIAIADTVMGVDNVLAIGGVAQDNIVLIILGLAICLPIIVWGSQLVMLIIERFPVVILLGSAVLAWTGFKMVGEEAVIHHFAESHPAILLAIGIAIAAFSLAPWFREGLGHYYRTVAIALPGMLVWLIGVGVVMDVLGVSRTVTGEPSLGEAALHFVRWVGWMPLAAAYFWLSERRRTAPQTKEAGHHPRHAVKS